MKNKLLLIFVFAAFTAIIGQNRYNVQIKKGLDLAYNFHLEESEKAFSKAIDIDKERPEAFYYTAQNHLWAFLGSKDKSELKIFLRWWDLAQQKGDALLKLNPNDPSTNYLLGNIYLLKAMANAADNSTLSAFSSSKSSFNYFEKTLELNPRFYSAKRGLALFHYATDFLPGLAKWAAGLTGLKADREMGFNLMRVSYQKGNEDKVESAFHLAKMYTDYTADYDSAISILKNLIAQYPSNPIFNYQAGVVLIKSGDLNEAEKYIDKVILLKHKAVMQMNLLAFFLKGDIYFKRNDFVNAEKYFQDFVDNAMDPDYTGIAGYRLAASAFINGRTDLFKKAIQEARKGNTDIFEDDYAKRKSEELNGNPFSDTEISIIKARNFSSAKKYSETIKILLPQAPDFKNIDLKKEAFILLSEASLALNKIEDAGRYIKTADSLEADVEEWLVPKTLYVKAKIEFKKGNFRGAENFCTQAAEENRFDFKNEFEPLIFNLKRKISKNR